MKKCKSIAHVCLNYYVNDVYVYYTESAVKRSQTIYNPPKTYKVRQVNEGKSADVGIEFHSSGNPPSFTKKQVSNNIREYNINV